MKYLYPVGITAASMGMAYFARVMTHDTVDPWLSLGAVAVAAGAGAWCAMKFLGKYQKSPR